MRSAFDTPVKVEDGVVEACGELDWSSGENQAHVTITISQKGEKLVGPAIRKLLTQLHERQQS